MDDLLTVEDREELRRYNGSNEDLFATVERIVRRHRAEAAAQELHYAARQVAYGVEWDDAPLSVEDWLHDRAYTLEMTDE